MNSVDNLTWTCHVCKEERPDAFISVFTRKVDQYMTVNLRYCNDNPKCASEVQFHPYLKILRDADGDPVGYTRVDPRKDKDA